MGQRIMENYVNSEYGWGAVIPKIYDGNPVNKYSDSICKVHQTGTGAGYMSKELINKMMVIFKRRGKSLTDLYISAEDAADIREWTDTDIDPVTRKEIFESASVGAVWNVTIHSKTQLGACGLCNINEYDSGYGEFLADKSNNFNVYHLDNPNKTASGGTITVLGETQILGFDSNDAKTFMEGSYYNNNLILFRTHELDFFKEDIKVPVLDPLMFCVGVIDRSL